MNIGTTTQIQTVSKFIPMQEQSSEEKVEINSTQNLTCASLLLLPNDVLSYLAMFLPSEKDIFTLEHLFKGAIDYTKLAWEKRAKQERLDSDWSLPDKEHYPERARYLHGKVLSVYISCRKKLTTDEQNRWLIPRYPQVKTLFTRFQGIMKRYPSSLGAYIWKDLNRLVKLYTTDYHLFQKDLSCESNIPLTAGDFLLKGLSHLSDYPYEMNLIQQQKIRRLAYGPLKQAILKGASFTSYLAIKVLFSLYPEYQWYYDLATLSLANNEDYRGLDLLLKNYSDLAAMLYKNGISHPPILVNVAYSKPTQEASYLIDQAIKDYKGYVPLEVWYYAVDVELKLENYKKAKIYADHAIAACENKIPAEIWHNAAIIESNLKNYEKAQQYATHAIASCKNNIPPVVWHQAADIELNLKNYEKARQYVNNAIVAYGNNVPPVIWHIAAVIESKLKNYEKAKQYANNAIKTCRNNIPDVVWRNAIDIELSALEIKLKNEKAKQ